MSALFEDVQKQVENMVGELEGEADFLPMMIVKDRRDQILCIGLVMPDESAGKDVVAGSMAAVCALYRAKEAAFTCVAWMVQREPGQPMPDKMPSQCEDRQEIVILTAVKADGTSAMFHAPMIRENNMCGVGLWNDLGPEMNASGRFVDAMQAGIAIGQNVPPDMAVYLDEQIEAGREARLVAMMTQMYVQNIDAINGQVKANEN